MSTNDPWAWAYKLLADSQELLDRYSLLNDLGDRHDLDYLKQQIFWQLGSNAPIPKWIDEISKKMEIQKVSQQKLDTLANEVGAGNVSRYLAAGILRLMQDYLMISIPVGIPPG